MRYLLALAIFFAACGGQPQLAPPPGQPTSAPQGAAEPNARRAQPSGATTASESTPVVVTMAAPVITNSLSRKVVQQTFIGNLGQVRHCYEQGLLRQPDLAGRVAVRWLIEPEGNVSDVAVRDSTLGDATVEACIVERVSRWRFPQPAGGGTVGVTVPFVLVGP